jgi:hypothetical protein
MEPSPRRIGRGSPWTNRRRLAWPPGRRRPPAARSAPSGGPSIRTSLPPTPPRSSPRSAHAAGRGCHARRLQSRASRPVPHRESADPILARCGGPRVQEARRSRPPARLSSLLSWWGAQCPECATDATDMGSRHHRPSAGVSRFMPGSAHRHSPQPRQQHDHGDDRQHGHGCRDPATQTAGERLRESGSGIAALYGPPAAKSGHGARRSSQPERVHPRHPEWRGGQRVRFVQDRAVALAVR